MFKILFSKGELNHILSCLHLHNAQSEENPINVSYFTLSLLNVEKQVLVILLEVINLMMMLVMSDCFLLMKNLNFPPMFLLHFEFTQLSLKYHCWLYDMRRCFSKGHHYKFGFSMAELTKHCTMLTLTSTGNSKSVLLHCCWYCGLLYSTWHWALPTLVLHLCDIDRIHKTFVSLSFIMNQTFSKGVSMPPSWDDKNMASRMAVLVILTFTDPHGMNPTFTLVAGNDFSRLLFLFLVTSMDSCWMDFHLKEIKTVTLGDCCHLNSEMTIYTHKWLSISKYTILSCTSNGLLTDSCENILCCNMVTSKLLFLSV